MHLFGDFYMRQETRQLEIVDLIGRTMFINH